LNPDHVFGSYGGVFGLQIAGFLIAAVLMRRLDAAGFRKNLRASFTDLV
jgi:BCD family chlorophyll transporter-like MFS transporter